MKITIDAVPEDRKSFCRIPEIRLRIAAKQKTDEGNGTANASDVGGTVVKLHKKFVDVQAITITPRNQDGVELLPAYDFLDAPDPTEFSVYLYRRSDGVRVSGDFSWIVRGV